MTNRRRRGPERVRVAPVLISIHAPREGSDCKNSQNFKLFLQQVDNFFRYLLLIPIQFLKTRSPVHGKRREIWCEPVVIFRVLALRT